MSNGPWSAFKVCFNYFCIYILNAKIPSVYCCNDCSLQDDLSDRSLRPSELFDHKVYLNEVCDVLAIALAELPALLQPKVSDSLLRSCGIVYG